MFKPPHEDDPHDLDAWLTDALNKGAVILLVVLLLIYIAARLIGF